MRRWATTRRAYRGLPCSLAVLLTSIGFPAVGSASTESILDIQSRADSGGRSLYAGEEVTISGTVTATFHDGYVVAEGPGAWQAVYVYSRRNAPEIGDEVVLTGTVNEYYGMTEIVYVTSYEHLGSGRPVIATPVSVAEVAQEQYESVLVVVEDVTVAALLSYGEWNVSDGLNHFLRCDDKNDYLYFPVMGDSLDSITGVLFYTYGSFKIEPRATYDIATGEPPPHYALHGHIVTMNDSRDVVVSAYLEIHGDEIAAIHSSRPRDLPVIEAGGLILPGLIDSHNHPRYSVLDDIPFQRFFTERSEWRSHYLYRRFTDQFTDIRNYGGPSAQLTNLWKLAEVRALTAGTTSIQGANCNGDGNSSFARRGIVLNNVERYPARVYHSTFPLLMGVEFWQERSLEYWDRFIVHLSEGTTSAALTEFYLLRNMGMLDERITIIHGVPYGPPEWAAMAAANASLVWSPVSNLTLYGVTADIPGALAAGVNVALAPDWTESGSHHLLDELKAANRLNQEEWGGVITPLQLAEFVTRNAAVAVGADELVGQIVPGFRANLMVIPGGPRHPYKALLKTEPANVKLTIVDGKPMYGNRDILAKFGFVDDVETIYVGGAEKGLAIRIGSDAVREADRPFSDVLAELEAAYWASEPKVCDFLGIE